MLDGANAVVVRKLLVEAGGASGSFTLRVRDLAIRSGECMAIVGPNGAGKSTFLNALVGLRSTRELEGTILGAPIKSAFRNWRRRYQLGVSLHTTAFLHSLRVDELLRFHRRVFGVQNARIVDQLDMASISQRQYGQLSRGQRGRLQLCMALSHEPSLVILDEPRSGLDHNMSMRLSEILQQHFLDVGRTVLIATHSAADLRISTRMLWLSDGNVVSIEAAAELRQRELGSRRSDLKFPDQTIRSAAYDRIRGLDGVLRVDRRGSLGLRVFGGNELDTLLQRLLREWRVSSYAFAPVDFDDVLYYTARVRDPLV